MRLLVCWELGGGLGHVRRVATLMHELRRRGHELFFASKDVVSAHDVLGDESVPVVPAPISFRGARDLPPAASYPEVLLRVGYRDPGNLSGLIRAWRDLFALTNPDAIIAEHAPTALLAAQVEDIRRIGIGTGFFLPPSGNPMPPLPAPRPPPARRLIAAEQQVLSVINGALKRCGSGPLASVADLFHLDGAFLSTYPELDHYGERKGTRYWGELEPPPAGDAPSWPRKGKGSRLFVYLHHSYRQFPALMRQLRDLGHPTLVVSPGIPDDLARKIRCSSLRVVPHTLNLQEVASASPTVLTHSGHGTAASLLRLGLPMVLLPNHVEQTVLAYRLARQGLGVIAGTDPDRERYDLLIARLGETDTYRQRAAAFAARYAGIDPSDQTRHLVDSMEASVRQER